MPRVLFAILQMYEFSSKSQLNAHICYYDLLFAILQMYEFSSKSQLSFFTFLILRVVCDTANVRVFKQITTKYLPMKFHLRLFAILQMYEFSSKSQHQCV